MYCDETWIHATHYKGMKANWIWSRIANGLPSKSRCSRKGRRKGRGDGKTSKKT